MTGRELSNKLSYLGMERDVRKLALDDKLESAENIAIMSTEEVCELIAQEYELVFSENEKIGLVRSEDLEKYNNLVKVISR